ncbi:RNA-binding protein Cwf29 [Neophaeococcomyces mojaviensis]|uniref:RNA-binding protein Cwf29 n=1 Tax=Neophaeococcomyces mojaviensis TaxID=3383035 RepID=A0ACC3A9E2_9EURO|nr:RNA-binding protein Cwf29 [Knufia sp. JES_112]
MNAIRQTQQLNRRELENATPPSASWHADYKDTAWVYIGGIPLDLSEGDVVTIFSQFGNPTHLNLIRDRETGKTKGFGFLKYEDQRSCDLAVDNLTGAEVLGRMLRVDHTRYKKRDDEDEDTWRIERMEAELETERDGGAKRASDTEGESEDEARRKKRRRRIGGEERLTIKENGEDDEDPMKDYMAREKKENPDRSRGSRHKHHHRRHRDDEGDEEARHESRRHRYRQDEDDDSKSQKRPHRDHDDQDHDRRRQTGKDDHDDRSRRDRRERKEHRRDHRSDESSPERTKPSTHQERQSPERRRRKRSTSRSIDHKHSRRDSSPDPINKGKSGRPGKLKFKGDD